MGVLSSSQRKALPKSDFAMPSKAPGPGSFPIPDRGHAMAAKRLAHNAPPAQQGRIVAKANRALGKPPGKGVNMGPVLPGLDKKP